jgi:hypothetical protein
VADIADDESIATIGAKLNGSVRLAVFAAGQPVGGSADTIEPGGFAVGANKLGLIRPLRSPRCRRNLGGRSQLCFPWDRFVETRKPVIAIGSSGWC